MKTNFTKTNIKEINKFKAVNEMKHRPMNFVYADSKMFILFDREKETFNVNHLHKNVDIDKVMKLCELYEKDIKKITELFELYEKERISKCTYFNLTGKFNKKSLDDFTLTSCDDKNISETFDIFHLNEMFDEEVLCLKTQPIKIAVFVGVVTKDFSDTNHKKMKMYFMKPKKSHGRDYVLCGSFGVSPIKNDFAQKLIGNKKLPDKYQCLELNFVIL